MSHTLYQVGTAGELEAYLLRDEVRRIVAHLGPEYGLAPCFLDDCGEYACRDCVEEPLGEGPYMSDGPVYCYNCELRLDYVVESRDEAYRCVDWLKSLIEQGIPVPRKNWADLSRAIDALPLTDKKWRAVEYVVYLGTSVDPELVSP